MGPRKRKNVIFLTLCVTISFILYQMYFLWSFMSEKSERTNMIVSIVDHSIIKEIKQVYSNADKFINENGVIRGVFYPNMKLYRPDSKNQLKCLNSEQRIPYEYLNDDYCDCEDGTDEPSTSACVNGTFHCDTQYLVKPTALHSVPSSKVNDGICDCCDGSDEWLNGNKKLLSQSLPKHIRHYVTKCSNNCK